VTLALAECIFDVSSILCTLVFVAFCMLPFISVLILFDAVVWYLDRVASSVGICGCGLLSGVVSSVL
jgi:hypothetical protein